MDADKFWQALSDGTDPAEVGKAIRAEIEEQYRTSLLALVRAEREDADSKWKAVPGYTPEDSFFDGYIRACDTFIAWLERS